MKRRRWSKRSADLASHELAVGSHRVHVGHHGGEGEGLTVVGEYAYHLAVVSENALDSSLGPHFDAQAFGQASQCLGYRPRTTDRIPDSAFGLHVGDAA